MPFPRRLFASPRLACIAFGALASGTLLPTSSHASAPGDALRQFGSATSLTRSIALADLGITEPVVLTGNASQDFYLPVPKRLSLADAAITLDGRYLKGQPGSASVVLSVDNQPMVSQSLSDGDGMLQRALAVAPRPRDTGFVRFSVNLQSNTGTHYCEADRSAGNSVVVSPQTRLTYHVDAAAVSSLDDAWNTLPGEPAILVSGAKLDAAAYDSAWRLGVALQHSGKRVSVRRACHPRIGCEARRSRL